MSRPTLVAQFRYDELSPPWDDGRLVRRDHEYGLEKVESWYRIAGAVSTAMRGKFPYRVCCDLYAGCGVNFIPEIPGLWWGSPLLSLQLAYPFDLYVFCEQDPAAANALTERIADPDMFGLDPLTLDLGSLTLAEDIRRIKGDTRDRKIVVMTGDANRAARYLRYLLPAWEGRRYVLTLLDPQRADFIWESMTMLTSRESMDLFVLFPEDFDIERNARREALLPKGTARLDAYFPDWQGWREIALDSSPRILGQLFRQIYKSGMERLLDYRDFGAHDIRIRNRAGSDIYTLFFASKHQKGKEIWDKVNPEEFEQILLPIL